jgi:hypothetical protein
VSGGYKTKPNVVFPTETQPADTVSAPTPTNPNRAPLKRPRSENDAELEEDTATPTLVVSASYNSYTTDEGDWEEPEWLLPREEVCADVEMEESR